MKKDEERKSEVFQIRITEAEKKKLKDLALKADLTIADLIRREVLEKKKGSG